MHAKSAHLFLQAPVILSVPEKTKFLKIISSLSTLEQIKTTAS